MRLRTVDGNDRESSSPVVPLAQAPVAEMIIFAPSEPVDKPPHVMTSVIVPTYNEAGNVALLLDRLRVALDGTCYEIVLVDDDSPDQTWRLAQLEAVGDSRIKVIRRRHDRGLSSAILAGMAQTSGDVIVVIDADLQHDERCIPDLVSGIVNGGSDLSVASRNAAGGDYGSFSRRRRLISWIGATLARLLLNVPISDPMSGFFALSRERFELLSNDIDPKGFKILLEFLARGPKPSVSEVGYRFGERHSGETKLNSIVVVDYLKALFTLALHRLSQRRRPTTE